MSDSGEAFASTIEYTLDGRTLQFARLRGVDLGRYEQRAKHRRAKLALAVLLESTEDVDEQARIRGEVMRELLFSTTPVSWTSELGSLEGLADMLWTAAKKAQPELTLEDVADLLTMQNMAEAVDLAMCLAYGGPPPKGDSDSPPEPPSPGSPSPSPS